MSAAKDYSPNRSRPTALGLVHPSPTTILVVVQLLLLNLCFICQQCDGIQQADRMCRIFIHSLINTCSCMLGLTRYVTMLGWFGSSGGGGKPLKSPPLGVWPALIYWSNRSTFLPSPMVMKERNQLRWFGHLVKKPPGSVDIDILHNVRTFTLGMMDDLNCRLNHGNCKDLTTHRPIRLCCDALMSHNNV